MSDTTVPAPAITEVIVDGLIERGLVRPADRQHGIDLVSAALAGRTVVELPGPTDGVGIWALPHGEVLATAGAGEGLVLAPGDYYLLPDEAHEFGLSLVAAAREARRLASESSGDCNCCIEDNDDGSAGYALAVAEQSGCFCAGGDGGHDVA